MARLGYYLSEGVLIESTDKLHPSDKNTIKTLIRSPRNTAFVLKSFDKNYTDDEREVEVLWHPPVVEFIYNMDFYELSNFLSDYADDQELEFTSDFDKPINTQYFSINKGKK